MSAIGVSAMADPAPVRVRPMVTRICPECGETFTAVRDQYPAQEFCCVEHKRTWNNRRATRGAVVFDLFMALRYERKRSTILTVWKLLCRLAQAYREEDLAQRGGRKSWRDPGAVLSERPWLNATVISNTTWRRPNVG